MQRLGLWFVHVLLTLCSASDQVMTIYTELDTKCKDSMLPGSLPGLIPGSTAHVIHTVIDLPVILPVTGCSAPMTFC